jgi:hypothetical protein
LFKNGYDKDKSGASNPFTPPQEKYHSPFILLYDPQPENKKQYDNGNNDIQCIHGKKLVINKCFNNRRFSLKHKLDVVTKANMVELSINTYEQSYRTE